MNQGNKIHIRAVSIDDVTSLQSISRQTFVETFGKDNTPEDMQQYLSENLSINQLSIELQHPHSSFYFATIDDKIVGYLKINTASAQTVTQENNALEIERIYVLHSYQGLHIGKALLNLAIDKARLLGFNTVWLGVWEHNIKAIHFYQQNGFKIYDAHIFPLGNDKQTDLLMRLEL